ncbi:MAG: hypothetical protein ACO3CX_08700, partial [Ilumatobacteraceae bacterium]
MASALGYPLAVAGSSALPRLLFVRREKQYNCHDPRIQRTHFLRALSLLGLRVGRSVTPQARRFRVEDGAKFGHAKQETSLNEESSQQ